MKCPECQLENREEASFCRKCGSSLNKEILCLHCQASNPSDSLFCEKCGHDLRQAKEPTQIDYAQPQSYTPKHLAEKILTTRSSVEGERKLVTVFSNSTLGKNCNSWLNMLQNLFIAKTLLWNGILFLGRNFFTIPQSEGLFFLKTYFGQE